MNKKDLQFDHLPPYQARQFVSQTIDLTDLKAIEPLFERLLAEDITSGEDLKSWVLKRSELETALDQKGAVLYIRMTCQTDDEARVQEYKHFIETVIPVIKVFEDRLNKKYIADAQRFPIDQNRYGIYTRAIRTDIELFSDKNVALQTKIDLLSQEYQEISGGLTVEFDGKERTMQEMGKFLLEPDRPLRERVWTSSTERRLSESAKLETLFEKMIALRDEMAKNAGFDNFRDYKFKSLHRFDYGPQDCFQYHQTIERLVVPLWRRILERRKEQMNLEQLRPWDTSVDPLGRPPLKPFDDGQDLVHGCQEIFLRVDKELGAQFVEMSEAGLLDLASRKGKAPGGYQSTLNEARKPFIFMNAVGTDSDVRTLLHEGGHAFHALACAHDPLLDYRHGPMEFNEVASMGMELLADRHLGAFYNEADETRSRVRHLEDIIFTLVWVATVDAFQHWIYEHPQHSAADRRKMWMTLHEKFGGNVVDWSGFEEARAYLWHRQLHIFEVPFYYIEYGIAQLGALQLWINNRSDHVNAIRQYRHALSFGGAKPLPELFQAAGLRFDFSEKMISPLMEQVQKELNELGH